MKYYIIAGESSGDLYGGLLMQALIQKDRQAQFRFWGGNKMKAHSSGQLKSLEDTAFMGFWEVAKNAMTIKKLFAFAKFSIDEFKPDMIIFIDYPGFNLRLLKWAKEKGYKTSFYISPQLWAWKKGRHALLRDYADLFFVILPFEVEFYKNLDTPCKYFGHPLLEIVPDQKELSNQVDNIALFPGSREQELKKHMQVLRSLCSQYPDKQFFIAGISHLDRNLYEPLIDNMELLMDTPEDLMSKCDLAISSSGTATLELALNGIPQIVIYKTSALSFAIGKKLVQTRFISLVNLIAGKAIVEELLQSELTLNNLISSFEALFDYDKRLAQHTAYKEIRQQLGEANTSDKVASEIYNFLESATS